MQIETCEKTLRLSELADEINNAQRECDEATVQTLANGMLAVHAAIRAGKSLARVKAKLVHGKYLKWLSENCPKISEETASRWVRLAKQSSVTDLSSAKSISDAFRMINDAHQGVDKEEKRALGTAAVDLYVELAMKLEKRAKSVLDTVGDVKPEELPAESRQKVIKALQPVVDLGAQLGIVPSRGLEVSA